MISAPITPAAPIKLTVSCKHKTVGTTGYQTIAFLPDSQIGYRQLPNGKLDSFHDERAHDLALQLLHDIKPDTVVLLGDYLDFAELSLKHAIEASFLRTTQASIERAYRFLVDVRATVGNKASIVLLEGNHDFRLGGLIEASTKALYGIKRAESLPDDYPLMSVPYLLRLDELGVSYQEGYPANRYPISDYLQAVHGTKVRSNGSTAKAVVDDISGTSTVFGHVHRREYAERTIHTQQGPRTIFAASPGCLCRIDGAVPSVKGGRTSKGHPVSNYENWQQGIGIAYVSKTDALDQHYTSVGFRQLDKNKMRAVIGGRRYTA